VQSLHNFPFPGILCSMPIYEFTCEQCGAIFDELLSLSKARSKVSCPSCGSSQTKRNLTGFGLSAPAGRSESNPSGGGCSPGGRVG